MNLKYFFFGLLFYLYYQFHQCNSERVSFIDAERPTIYSYDKKYFKNFTIFSKRLNRSDPRHYLELYIESLIRLTNGIKLDFYFYQFLTNRYRPSFVEMHFNLCDMINSDSFFGQSMLKAVGGRLCPYPPGEYYLRNMSIPYVPTGFPFAKGRIYCNASIIEGGLNKIVFTGGIDMEIKVANIKRP